MPTRRASLGRVSLLALILAAALPAHARGQGVTGHVSGGPVALHNMGNRSLAWQFGGGGELLSGPYGFGGEIDYVYFPLVERTFDGGRGSSSSPAVRSGTASLTATIYLGDFVRGRRTRPFLTGGVTYLFDAGEVLPMLVLAGGVDWWTARRTGFRLEIREQLPAMLVIRGGIVFRR